MKKLLLLIATFAFFTSVQEVHAEGAYAGITGGLNWLQEKRNQHVDVDLDAGHIFTGTIGYGCDCGLRAEGELGYRYNRFSKLELKDYNLRLHGNIRLWSVMANVLYDLPVDFCVQPYVGAGIGYAKTTTHLKHKPVGVSDVSSTEGFTHQFIAGAQHPLNDYLSLDAKYRYQKTQHLTHNQSVELGLVYAF